MDICKTQTYSQTQVGQHNWSDITHLYSIFKMNTCCIISLNLYKDKWICIPNSLLTYYSTVIRDGCGVHNLNRWVEGQLINKEIAFLII